MIFFGFFWSFWPEYGGDFFISESFRDTGVRAELLAGFRAGDAQDNREVDGGKPGEAQDSSFPSSSTGPKSFGPKDFFKT